MFNIDFESEKSKSLINFGKYGLTAVLVALITIALVFAAGGYDIDKHTGEIIHNGLVIVASEPGPADIYVNGQSENDATKSKLSLPVGQYEILLKSEGFYDWSKKISVEGSDVVWLHYPRLIPIDIKTSNVEPFKDIQMTSQTPDYKSLLLHEKNGGAQLLLINLTDQGSSPKEVNIPVSVLNLEPNGLSVFTVIDWAHDNKTVLLNHSNGTTNELVLLDVTKPENARNLTSLFELGMSDFRFIDNSKDKLYAIVNSSLRRLDVNAGTVTGSLIDNVSQYSADDGLVVAIHGKTGEVKVSILDGDKLVKFADLEAQSTNYLVAINQFDGDRYLALADKVAGVVSIYKAPLKIADSPDQKTELAKLSLLDLRYLNFSPNGQFVVAQSGKSFRLYDFDTEQKRAFNAKVEIESNTQTKWIDSFHLNLIDDKGATYFVDYDGQNAHKINDIDKSIGAFYTDKIEGMYFFKTDKSGSDILSYSSLMVQQF